jgi:hypothetical protein
MVKSWPQSLASTSKDQVILTACDVGTHLYDKNVGHADQRQNGPKILGQINTMRRTGALTTNKHVVRLGHVFSDENRCAISLSEAHSLLSSRSMRELCTVCAHGRTAGGCAEICAIVQGQNNDRKGHKWTRSRVRATVGNLEALSLPKRRSSLSGARHSDRSPARWQECGGFRPAPFGQKE